MSRGGRNMERLRVLAERRAWLERRLSETDGSEGSLGHARKEVDALNWVIPMVEAVAVTERELARDPARQQVESSWRMSATWALRRLYAVDREAYDSIVAHAHPRVAVSLRADMDRCLAGSGSLGRHP